MQPQFISADVEADVERLVGMLVLGESRAAARIASIALILIGVIGLRVFAPK